MTLVAPDPHPGRCQNHRTEFRGGRLVSLRCLDYETVRHVCTFEEPPSAPTASSASITYSLTVPKPEPWVKPGGDQ